MNQEIQDHIRKSLVGQVAGILDTYGESLKNTTLEFDLTTVLRQLSGVATTPALPLPQQPVGDLQVPVARAAQAAPIFGHIEDDDDWVEDFDDDLEDELDEEVPVPEGFADEAAYQNFLLTQQAVLPTDEDGVVARPDSVSGMQQDDNGNWVEVGDMGLNLAKVDELIEEANTIRDEETGEVLVRNEVPTVETISISLTREDGNVLTDAHVETILASPQVGVMSRVFGHNYVCNDGAEAGERLITFTLPERDESKATGRGLIHGNNLMQFGGYLVFPAIGGVTAKLVA